MLRRHARRVGVFVAGWLIVVVGIVLCVVPGPGLATIFVGLSLLSTEFAWAARLKRRVQQWVVALARRVQAWHAARRRRRSGIVDVVVDEVLVDAEAVAERDDDDGVSDQRSIAS